MSAPDNRKYEEILNLPHHVSVKHPRTTRPQMPLSDRAAQFAPFAALTGYHSAIEETGRQIETRFEKPPHEPEEDEWQPE